MAFASRWRKVVEASRRRPHSATRIISLFASMAFSSTMSTVRSANANDDAMDGGIFVRIRTRGCVDARMRARAMTLDDG